MAEINELKHVSVATTYDLTDNFDSDKFIKMRLRVCHDGTNPNGSHFELADMTKAQDGIKNIPILANVIFDEDDQPQFGGHDMSIEKDKVNEGNYRTIYKEVPIGVIPETNNYSVEEYEGRNYVFVDGYIWRGYSNYAEDIINRDKNVKLSMEINVDEFFYNANEKVYNITDYRYTGITFLGSDYGTGMKNALATTETFAEKNYTDQMLMIMQELKDALATFNKKNSEEGGNMAMENENVMTAQPVVEGEPVVMSNENEPEVTAVPDSGSIENEVKPTTEAAEYFIKSFTYAPDDVICSLYSKIEDDCVIHSVYDNFFVYAKCKKKKNYKQVYSMEGTEVVFDGEPSEVIVSVYTQEEMDALDQMKTKYAEMEAALEELKAYKADIEKAAIDAQKSEIISKWSEILKDNEQFNALKNEVEKYSVEELETKCKCIFADTKAVFAAKVPTKETVVRIPVSVQAEQKNEPYGGLFSEYQN